VLGRERRKLGAKNIALVAAILFAYVFGQTAWRQSAELPADVPTGVRVSFIVSFVLLGFGLPWLGYLLYRLVRRIFGGPRPGAGGTEG